METYTNENNTTISRNNAGEIGKNILFVGHVRGRWGGKNNTTTNRVRGERQKRSNVDAGGRMVTAITTQQSPEVEIILLFCCAACLVSII